MEAGQGREEGIVQLQVRLGGVTLHLEKLLPVLFGPLELPHDAQEGHPRVVDVQLRKLAGGVLFVPFGEFVATRDHLVFVHEAAGELQVVARAFSKEILGQLNPRQAKVDRQTLLVFPKEIQHLLPFPVKGFQFHSGKQPDADPIAQTGRGLCQIARFHPAGKPPEEGPVAIL